MFITAVCFIFLIKLRWPKTKSLENTFPGNTLGWIWFHNQEESQNAAVFQTKTCSFCLFNAGCRRSHPHVRLISVLPNKLVSWPGRSFANCLQKQVRCLILKPFWNPFRIRSNRIFFHRICRPLNTAIQNLMPLSSWTALSVRFDTKTSDIKMAARTRLWRVLKRMAHVEVFTFPF